jgi:hypothetical protein
MYGFSTIRSLNTRGLATPDSPIYFVNSLCWSQSELAASGE